VGGRRKAPERKKQKKKTVIEHPFLKEKIAIIGEADWGKDHRLRSEEVDH